MIPPTPPTVLDERFITLKELSVETRFSMLTEVASKAAFQEVCRRTPGTDPGTDSCSNCGACCQRVLPLTPAEITDIKTLLKEDHKLRKYILALNKSLPLRLCPFLDFTQREHKCLIYSSPALPRICEFYTCNPKVREKNPPESQYPPDTKVSHTDMWHTFFIKATSAPDITNAWLDKDLLQLLNRLPPHEVLKTPEKLPEYFKDFSWSNLMFKALPRHDIPNAFLYSCDDRKVKEFLWKYVAKKLLNSSK